LIAAASRLFFAHDPRHALMVNLHALAAQLGRDPAVAIASPVFQRDPLNRRAHLYLFFRRLSFG
jgi:hypothetical protein